MRAAILIGVDKTGGLTRLADAAKGARAMEAWALAQKMERENVIRFTDDDGPVEAHAIRKAITGLVDAGNIKQLIIYFAGHGVNIRYGEYWLLSGAPADTSAAINVDGCVYRARASGIPHVVFISDACRSAAQGIQGQGIEGSVVFPNDPVPGPEQSVDMFFATTLGRPALEVRESADTASAYKALYTGAFLDAVHGRLPGCLAADGTARVVRPRLLKTCLSSALPHRISLASLASTVSQIPDARVTSGDEAWLARFPEESPVESPMESPVESPVESPMEDVPPQAAPSDSDVPTPRGPVIMSPGNLKVRLPPGSVYRNATPQDKATLEINKLLGDLLVPGEPQPRAPRHRPRIDPFEGHDMELPSLDVSKNSGIAVRGGKIAQYFIPGNAVANGSNRHWFELDLDSPVVDALITFDDGSAALLPVMQGYVTGLTFDDGELVDVGFEPVDSFPQSGRIDQKLHAAIAHAARGGLFHLDGDNGRLLEAHLQRAGAIDPALALYAAYGFHDQGMRTALLDLDRALKEQLSFSFFDIGLLCKNLAPGTLPQQDYRPVVPMLARGWSIWASAQAQMPDALIGLQREVLPSLWTHFTAAGAARLHAFLSNRSIT